MAYLSLSFLVYNYAYFATRSISPVILLASIGLLHTRYTALVTWQAEKAGLAAPRSAGVKSLRHASISMRCGGFLK